MSTAEFRGSYSLIQPVCKGSTKAKANEIYFCRVVKNHQRARPGFCEAGNSERGITDLAHERRNVHRVGGETHPKSHGGLDSEETGHQLFQLFVDAEVTCQDRENRGATVTSLSSARQFHAAKTLMHQLIPICTGVGTLTIAVAINEKAAAAEREIEKVQRDSVFQEVLENGYRLVCIKPERCEVAPVFAAIPMQRSPSGLPQVKSIGIFPPPLRLKAPAGVFRQHRRPDATFS